MTIRFPSPRWFVFGVLWSLAVAVAAEDVPVPDAAVPAAAVPAAASEGQALDLTDALALAFKRNEVSVIARARIDAAVAKRREAYALILPSLTLSGSASSSSVSHDPYGSRSNEATTGEAALSLALFNASAFPLVTAGGKNLEAQQLDSAELQRDLGFRTVTGFLDVLAFEATRTAAIKRKTVAEQVLSDARARVRAGLASNNDATRSELEVANANLTLIQAAQAVATSRLALADLLVQSLDSQPLALPGPAELPQGELPRLIELAYAERADLKSLGMRRDVTALQAKSQALGIVPQIGVRGSYLDRDLNAPNVSEQAPEWRVALTADWTLYDGGGREARVAGFDAQAREASAQILAARRGVVRDLATAQGQLSSAEAGVAQAEVAVRVAGINAREVAAKFKQGLATALDQADATAAQFDAEANLVRAKLANAQAGFALRRLVGWWPLTRFVPKAEAAPKAEASQKSGGQPADPAAH